MDTLELVRPQRHAVRCLYLKMTMGAVPGSGLVNLCTHIIRDDRECVGPFLDETATTCGLWEEKPGAAR